MKSDMKNIECEGLLYRGNDIGAPTEIWDYPRKRWVRFHGGPFAGTPGREIEDAEAELLKAENAAAEHFLWFDIPPWIQPRSPAYRRAVVPKPVRDAIAARLRQRRREIRGTS
jgi:hypothetical protein